MTDSIIQDAWASPVPLLCGCEATTSKASGRISITGRSVAGRHTSFYIPEAGLLLDAGLRSVFNPAVIAVTHGHCDHSGALPFILNDMSAHRTPTLLVPPTTSTFFKQYLDAAIAVTTDGAFHDSTQEYSYTLKEATQEHAWTHKGRRWVLEPYTCHHRVRSVGYGLSEVTRKLRPEYRDLTSTQVRELRTTLGDQIYCNTATPLLAFCGDTTNKVFELNPQLVSKYPIIFVECTYLTTGTEESLITVAEKRGHMCWHQLSPVVRDHPHTSFYLIHFSPRYDASMIRDFLEKTECHNAIPWLPLES